MNRIVCRALLRPAFFSLLAVVGMSPAFSGEPPKKIADWSGFTVWLEEEPGEATGTVLRFRNPKGAVVHAEDVRPPVTTGTMSTAYGRFFTAASFSGGESGCCLNLHVFYPHEAIVGGLLLQSTAYGGPITVRDLNGDGIDEIRVDSVQAYGLTANVGTKNQRCEAALTPGVHMGLSDIRIPQYLHINKKKVFDFEDVTFTPPLQKALTAELAGAESRLAAIPRTIEAPSADLAALFQIFRARRAVSGEKDALQRIRKIGINVKYECDGKKQAAVNAATLLENAAVRDALK